MDMTTVAGVIFTLLTLIALILFTHVGWSIWMFCLKTLLTVCILSIGSTIMEFFYSYFQPKESKTPLPKLKILSHRANINNFIPVTSKRLRNILNSTPFDISSMKSIDSHSENVPNIIETCDPILDEIEAEMDPEVISTRRNVASSISYKQRLPSLRQSPPVDQASRNILPPLQVSRHLGVPITNTVPGETRTRKSTKLYKSRMRVGKTLIHKEAGTNKEFGLYMIRIDCSEPGDKHMNPVVMWDISCRFSEFVKLQEDVKKELQEKESIVKIPSLPYKTFFPRLSDSFLRKRKEHLQKFLNEMVENEELAETKAFRVFCKAE